MSDDEKCSGCGHSEDIHSSGGGCLSGRNDADGRDWFCACRTYSVRPESMLRAVDFDIEDDPRGTVVDFVTAPKDEFDW